MTKYDTYKESGIEWIGKIPNHWEYLRLQWISEIENSGVWGEDDPFKNSVEIPIPTTGQLSKNGVWDYDKMNIRNVSLQEYQKYKCLFGDIVVVKSSGSSSNIITGKCGYISLNDNEKFGFSNFLMRVRPTRINSKLLYYFLQSDITKQRIERMVSSTTYPNLKVEEYVKSGIFVPSKNEQNQIVIFLDEKTTIIDTLIQKPNKKSTH
jgi:type I restriction enzyme, S subunit